MTFYFCCNSLSASRHAAERGTNERRKDSSSSRIPIDIDMTTMESLGLMDKSLYDIGEQDLMDVWDADLNAVSEETNPTEL